MPMGTNNTKLVSVNTNTHLPSSGSTDYDVCFDHLSCKLIELGLL